MRLLVNCKRFYLLIVVILLSSTSSKAEEREEKSVYDICKKLFNKKQYSEVLSNLDEITKWDTLVYEQAMLRCNCYLKLNDEEALTETYLKTLETDIDSVDVKKFYMDMRDMLSSINRDRFDYMPAEDLQQNLISYWRARDIDPFTNENEYVVEHLRRLDFVRMFYSSPRSQGYDDRGKIYLKHGKPVNIVQRPGELATNENRESVLTMPFESWQYFTNDGHRIYHFFDRFSTGLYSLETDLLDSSLRRKMVLGRFLDECSELDSRYLSMLQADAESQEMLLMEEMQNRELDITAAEMTDVAFTPVEIASIEQPVNFLFDFYRYQSLRYPSMVDINIVVALPANEINFREIGEKYESEVEVGAVYFDKKWEQFAKYDQLKEYSFSEKPKDTHFLFQGFWTRVPPGDYHLAIKAITADSRKGQIYKMGFDVETFRTGKLSLSDIQIGSKIPRGNRYNMDEDRIPLVANPFHVFDKTKPLRIFFEIYNLTSDFNNKSQYSVMYAVRSLDSSKETIISLRQEYEGEPELERVILDINISKLPYGKTKLTVMVEDLKSGETVERDYEFEIMKE